MTSNGLMTLVMSYFTENDKFAAAEPILSATNVYSPVNLVYVVCGWRSAHAIHSVAELTVGILAQQNVLIR